MWSRLHGEEVLEIYEQWPVVATKIAKAVWHAA